MVRRASLATASLTALGIAMMSLGSAHAQQKEIFHGSELRNTFGAGVLVSATKRGDGNEVLRIRASSQTAQPFMKTKLPSPVGARPYDFTLVIGEPPVVGQKCSKFPESKAEFEDCFATKPVQSWRGWSTVELEAVDAEIKQLGLRSTTQPPAYAICGYVPSHKILLSCDFSFEQGGHQHLLSTSAVALDDIAAFRCAALELRNAIWPDAPGLADSCP